jgi:carbamoyl-phosphate synthase small subunit
MGAPGQAFGELVFNTSMTGYQEIGTDPSYCGQIVTYTAPQIGNVGICEQDAQAERPRLSGMVVRELSEGASNWRSEARLSDWLARHGITGITEVDTRAVTRHLRERGAMRAGIWTDVPRDVDTAKLVDEVRRTPSIQGRNLASVVTTDEPYTVPAREPRRGQVALVDFGVKRGIINGLTTRGLQVQVVPATSTVQQVLQRNPDGVVLSNGPGDPAPVECGIKLARELLGRLPLLGICLGHQILALAMGARTFKMRFGHHGGNHPVRDETSGQVWITAQNHGFAVDPTSLPSAAQVTHISLYDGTLEGFVAPDKKMLAVQFHPEGCPGPSDAAEIFDRFLTLMV